MNGKRKLPANTIQTFTLRKETQGFAHLSSPKKQNALKGSIPASSADARRATSVIGANSDLMRPFSGSVSLSTNLTQSQFDDRG